MQVLSSATRIVLLVLTLTLCYLAVRQMAIPAEFKDIILMVMSFYFGGKTSTTEPQKPEPSQDIVLEK